MIWFTWRQFRTQTWIAVGALAVLGTLLIVVGRQVAAVYADSGLATCTANCEQLASAFSLQVDHGLTGTVYDTAIAAMYLVPALIGAFWGAPLIARELETGTYRLAWNQSVTRTRWLVTKLAVVGAVSIGVTGLLELAVTWSATDIDRVTDARIAPLLFGARGVVPLAYAAFAFTLGVTLGLLLRRTVAAMAATLALYTAAAAVMPLFLRAYLAPITRTTTPLDLDTIEGMSMSQNGAFMRIEGPQELPGAWLLSNTTITPTGGEFTGPADPTRCGRDLSPKDCLEWIGSLGLRQDLYYHPGNQFWTLQWAESGVFLAAAGLLVGFCVWWVRRRNV